MLCTGVTNKYLYEELFYSIFLICNHVTRRPCWWSTIEFFSWRIYMKIEFSFQRREMLLFLTTNMAAVTSRANQQLEEPIVILATIGLQGEVSKGEGKVGKRDSGQELWLGFIINESLIRIALWLHDLWFTSVCRLSSWKTLNSAEAGNQFNSTFCSQFRLFALKKFQISALFGNNWRALRQWACWNFCMFIILIPKSSKFITHFTGREAKGA